jgi:hypothetical protein
VTLRARWVTLESSLGDAESSLGDAESSLGDAKSSPGDAESSLGDVQVGRLRCSETVTAAGDLPFSTRHCRFNWYRIDPAREGTSSKKLKPVRAPPPAPRRCFATARFIRR